MAHRNYFENYSSPTHDRKIKVDITPFSGEGRAVQSNYDAPGFVEDLNTPELKRMWNSVIATEYGNLKSYHGRFFNLNAENISGGQDYDVVKWHADPAEPDFCFDEIVAQSLSDWNLTYRQHPLHSALSVRGRNQTHNEYCEYRIVFAEDPNTKKLRPKRVLFTTELREYWMLLAQHSPERLVWACNQALGFKPSWSALYGPGVSDPALLSADDRLSLFATWVSGGAGRDDLLRKGVPLQPIGPLNNEHALFMTHQINGLDDLLYIVLYGAHPYARKEGGTWIKAAKDEIFNLKHFGEKTPPIQLACRHADPAAALGAAGQAFDGRQIGFANPLGMYFSSFAEGDFTFEGQPVPKEWIQFKRGKKQGFYQRLEFGPRDEDPHFLDEINVGDNDDPVIGGFQIAKRIEVGPWLKIGSPSVVTDQEYERFKVEKLDESYNCAQADVCRRIARLRDEYDEYKAEEIRL